MRGALPLRSISERASRSQAAAPFLRRGGERASSEPEHLLPEVYRPPEAQDAVSFLGGRLHEASRPVRILALGALTNLALAGPGPALHDIVAMGGAFGIPGNVPGQPGAEWNFFADPAAADLVCSFGIPTLLVPLNAARQVPLTEKMARALGSTPSRPLARVANGLMQCLGHQAYAWDPLAAVALAEPSVVVVKYHGVRVRAGVAEWSDGAPICVAYGANSKLFETRFTCGLTSGGPLPA